MTEYEYTDRDGDKLRIRAAAVLRGVALVKTAGQEMGTYVPADRVEEVCAALREAAGLPPVWTVEKVEVFEGDVAFAGDLITPLISYSLNPSGARNYASQLLSAADEAEARASRPKLPTAEDSVIKVGDVVFVRHGGSWYCPGLLGPTDDAYMASEDFTVLYDPEEATA